jgi:predicted lipid-binding transport protein (Tim44 family)
LTLVTATAILGEHSPLGTNDSSGLPAVAGVFIFLFLVLFVVSIVVAIFRFSQTRQMALKKGATQGEATVLAMSGPVGTAAAFVAANPSNHSSSGPASAEARIREVRALQAKGLITTEQAEARVDEILQGM